MSNLKDLLIDRSDLWARHITLFEMSRFVDTSDLWAVRCIQRNIKGAQFLLRWQQQIPYLQSFSTPTQKLPKTKSNMSQFKTVLVAGGTGGLGAFIVDEFVANGNYTVKILTRPSSQAVCSWDIVDGIPVSFERFCCSMVDPCGFSHLFYFNIEHACWYWKVQGHWRRDRCRRVQRSRCSRQGS